MSHVGAPGCDGGALPGGTGAGGGGAVPGGLVGLPGGIGTVPGGAGAAPGGVGGFWGGGPGLGPGGGTAGVSPGGAMGDVGAVPDAPGPGAVGAAPPGGAEVGAALLGSAIVAAPKQTPHNKRSLAVGFMDRSSCGQRTRRQTRAGPPRCRQLMSDAAHFARLPPRRLDAQPPLTQALTFDHDPRHKTGAVPSITDLCDALLAQRVIRD